MSCTNLQLGQLAMLMDIYAKVLAHIELINDEIFLTEKQLQWMKADWKQARPRLEAVINNDNLSLDRRQKAKKLKTLGINYIRQMEANVSSARKIRQELEEYYNHKTNAEYGEMPVVVFSSRSPRNSRS